MRSDGMENEELAALRASLLAAERQPAAVKQRQARLSAMLAEGDELVPYVLAAPCCDPRDRVVHDDPSSLRVLEGRQPTAWTRREPPCYEPPPLPPSRLAAALACIAVLWLLGHALTFFLLGH
jgi:hypothetical protein